MSKQVTLVADSIIAAHEAFKSGDPKHQKAGLLLVRRALTSPGAEQFVAGLEVAARQLAVAYEEELEDIDRMGDDPSVKSAGPYEPAEPTDDEDDTPLDEEDEAASPADEELTTGEDEPESEADIQADVADEIVEESTAAIVKSRPLVVGRAIRHAAQCVARVRGNS